MFHKYLKEKYKFMTNYFETASKNTMRTFPHSIILYGSDALAQYIFALNLAKIMNCSENKNFECKCINCRWIGENKHPAVYTYSKTNNKPTDDDSKSVISVSQIRQIRATLANTSQYHRFFIFCDAETKQISSDQQKNLDFFTQSGFLMPTNEDTEIWYPMPLKQNVLPDVAANALLKSIEEPPEKVTFIFLTASKDDLISTIISRSQVFHIPGFFNTNYENEIIEKMLQKYPALSIGEAIEISENLMGYMTKQNLKPQYILCSIQNYLQKLAVANKNNRILYNKIINDIYNLKDASIQISSSIKEQNVFEALMLKFVS